MCSPHRPTTSCGSAPTPAIVVAAGTDLDDVHRLVTEAHHRCYVANTISSDITLEPSVETAPQAQ